MKTFSICLLLVSGQATRLLQNTATGDGDDGFMMDFHNDMQDDFGWWEDMPATGGTTGGDGPPQTAEMAQQDSEEQSDSDLSDFDDFGGAGPDDIPDDIVMDLIDEDYDYGAPL